MALEKIVISWSGGKDSSMMLYELRKHNKFAIVSLLTTVTEEYDRISMHGVRRVLLERQAEELGIPLKIVWITPHASNEEYESGMKAALEAFKSRGVTGVAFGDLFLEDLKKYREEKLAQLQLKGIFPLWKRDTRELARKFIRQGFKTVLTCVDTKVLDGKFSGREYDENLLGDLPPSVDPCGENGEFHSFCYAGPVFKNPILFTRGEQTLRDERFQFTDLVPA